MNSSQKLQKVLAAFFILLYLILSALLLVYVGRPFIAFLDQPEQFRQWIDARGFAGQAVFLLMIVLQVFVAVIPGEPLEIAAGYAFGWFGGTLLCLLGTAVGSALVFVLVRRYGTRVLDLFLSREKIRSMKFLQNTDRLKRLMFVLFLIPGTPKDLLTYIAGLTPIRMSDFLILSTFARIPSLVTSIVGGSALGDGEYLTAAIVFAATAAVSLLGLFVYSKIKQHKTRT
ncbi:MAG: TVP38/TMEM64 family protein [Clostridia bacterium]|nr:TVP38/TMEM64 family protein [Clostridia bacterium]